MIKIWYLYLLKKYFIEFIKTKIRNILLFQIRNVVLLPSSLCKKCIKMNKLSILIPVFNEGNTIHLILDKIKNTTLPENISKEIIIINDCSTDKTSEKIKEYIIDNQELSIILLEHNKNKGKWLLQK